jgi:hypothetical protein
MFLLLPLLFLGKRAHRELRRPSRRYIFGLFNKYLYYPSDLLTCSMKGFAQVLGIFLRKDTRDHHPNLVRFLMIQALKEVYYKACDALSILIISSINSSRNKGR